MADIPEQPLTRDNRHQYSRAMLSNTPSVVANQRLHDWHRSLMAVVNDRRRVFNRSSSLLVPFTELADFGLAHVAAVLKRQNQCPRVRAEAARIVAVGLSTA